MTRRRHTTPQPTAPVRALALLLAWLVFGLTLASVSPEVHAFAHGHAGEATQGHGSAHAHDHDHDAPATDADHRCAVVLYAHGAALPVVAVELPPPPAADRESATNGRPELFLTTPRYLRQPERGPPVLG